MAPRPMRNVMRAAAAGLAGGLGIAAVVLLTFAVLRARAECESPGTEECTFQKQVDGSVARLQGLGALGCALVAGGLAIAARRARP